MGGVGGGAFLHAVVNCRSGYRGAPYFDRPQGKQRTPSSNSCNAEGGFVYGPADFMCRMSEGVLGYKSFALCVLPAIEHTT